MTEEMIKVLLDKWKQGHPDETSADGQEGQRSLIVTLKVPQGHTGP